VNPLTRFVAVEAKATYRPSALIAGPLAVLFAGWGGFEFVGSCDTNNVEGVQPVCPVQKLVQ
jgi:hypothetical protein